MHSFSSGYSHRLFIVPNTLTPLLGTPLPSIHLHPILCFKSNLNHHFPFGMFACPGLLRRPVPPSTSPFQHLAHLSCNH